MPLNALPHDVLHLILSSAASNGESDALHSLISLSSTSRPFRTIYNSNEVRLLASALASITTHSSNGTAEQATLLARKDLFQSSQLANAEAADYFKAIISQHLELVRFARFMRNITHIFDDHEEHPYPQYPLNEWVTASYTYALEGIPANARNRCFSEFPKPLNALRDCIEHLLDRIYDDAREIYSEDSEGLIGIERVLDEYCDELYEAGRWWFVGRLEGCWIEGENEWEGARGDGLIDEESAERYRQWENENVKGKRLQWFKEHDWK